MSLADAQAIRAALLGSNLAAKIDHINALKTHVKRNDVDEDAFLAIAEALKLGISSAQADVCTLAFNCAGHLVKRLLAMLSRDQDENVPLAMTIRIFTPAVLEAIAGPAGFSARNREKFRNKLTEWWKDNDRDVERAFKEFGFSSPSWQIREQSILWVPYTAGMQQKFSFRSFMPYLMRALEDGSGIVRDAAKRAIVELFRNSSAALKEELRSDLSSRCQVKKDIIDFILEHISDPTTDKSPKGHKSDLTTDKPPEGHKSAANCSKILEQPNTPQHPGEHPQPLPRKEGRMTHTTTRQRSVSAQPRIPSAANSDNSVTSVISLSSEKIEPLEPVMINSSRELENELHNMIPAFQDRESEKNWALRSKHIARLRGFVRGNGFSDYPTVFIAGIRDLRDGIIKAMNSLRTTLSLAACALVKELAIFTGSAIDSIVEIFLMSLIKLTGLTKKITAQAAEGVVSSLISNTTFHLRTLQMIQLASQDKNVYPRVCAGRWLRVLLVKGLHHRHVLENAHTLDTIDEIIRCGLTDANPAVREAMRDTFWKYCEHWPSKKDSIIRKLDATARKPLEKSDRENIPLRSYSIGETIENVRRELVGKKLDTGRRVASARFNHLRGDYGNGNSTKTE